MSTTIEQRISELREEWRTTPERRSTIELQVKYLKKALTLPKYIPFTEKPKQLTAQEIKESLFAG